MKTPPAIAPIMEPGKLTKQHIGMRVVANMFSDDLRKPKRYGTLVSFGKDDVLCDFGNGKAKIPYAELDFDYCQDGWMFDVYDASPIGAEADAKRVQARIDAMFRKPR